MRLAFLTVELRTVCEDEGAAIALYGRPVANVLQTRLADINAAENVSDIVAGEPKYIVNDVGALLVLSLIEGIELIFSVAHTKKTPKNAQNEVDWAHVNYIQLIEIQKQ